MRTLVLSTVLALAGCLPASPDPRGVKADEVLLQVEATGRGEAPPDEARILVGVTSIQPTATEASVDATQTLLRISGSLRGLGVKPGQLQSRSLTLVRIDYGPERGRFRADNTIEVRIDPRRAGEVVALATDAGGIVLSGPDLRVREPERAYSAAYVTAYRAARARAEVYASAAGLKVLRVLTISDADQALNWPEGRTSVGSAAQASTPAPPVSPGVNVREVRVQASFALGR